MCGFAGEFCLGGGQANLSLVCQMANKLHHRGPDEEGRFLSNDGHCAIGFQRLSVIDPSGSHQPMSSADGTVTVAFNGEIYNYRTLRDELTSDGAAFQTAGDTEVLLHLFKRYGQAMVCHLEGMFSFVLYDAANGRLILSRDRLGQKPLWYALLDDRIVFASEPKALLLHNKINMSYNMLSIQHYLSCGYIPSPNTIWSCISKLPPASILSLPSSSPKPNVYWRPEHRKISSSSKDIIDEVRSKTITSVEKCMVSDVPIGALLSGGIDSSIIVAIMAKLAGRTGGVKTFTAGFAQGRYDERLPARQVATYCRTEHTELEVRVVPELVLDKLVEMYDEPFSDSSAFPMYLICKAARQHVTVALTGDGGDEVFGGYDRYRALYLAATMSPAKYALARLGAAVIRPWASHEERSPLRRFIRFAETLPLPSALQYFCHRGLFMPADLPNLLTKEALGASGNDLQATERWFCDLYEKHTLPDEVARAQSHDFLTYLPDDLLVKSDIASMASSLELRSPILDHPLVNLGFSLPLELKVSSRKGKLILRKGFSDMLPREVLQRPKRGFGVPLGDWLRNELRHILIDTLTDKSFIRRMIVREEAVCGLINDHLAGRDDHRHRLWALLILARWLDKHAQ